MHGAWLFIMVLDKAEYSGLELQENFICKEGYGETRVFRLSVFHSPFHHIRRFSHVTCRSQNSYRGKDF